ncbi:MAG: beta-ketoacyl-[acyl-carrier-protein] synthase II, partial [Planctomycetota bacterium]
EDGHFDPHDVGYINAHGTSTSLGDQAETIAVKSVFKEHARDVAISSTKSQLGHMLGASGGVEIVLTVLALREGVVPPTINYRTPDPLCDLDYTPNETRQREFSVAMSNSFGFGGHNASLLVGHMRNGSP